MRINVRKTIENTVTCADEFPFYIEELSANDEMPTLLGIADEKYGFNEMDDDFFEFVSRKINENGVYIRLIHIVEKSCQSNTVTFEIETGLSKTTIKTDFEAPEEVTDIGIKIHCDEVTVGTTSYFEIPHFESIDKNKFLSSIADEMIEDLIFYD